VSGRPVDLDVRGLSCPEPVLKVRKMLDTGFDNQLSVVTDSRVTLENISRLARHAGYIISSEEQDGHYYLLLRRKNTGV